MGFTMADSMFYQPMHFTHLLQNVCFDDYNRKERKEEVMRIYDSYKWERQGNFHIEKEEDGARQVYRYNTTKKEIHYLKKRKRNEAEEEEVVEPKVVPFITFEDIKKDLDESPSTTMAKEKDNFVIR